MFWRGSGTCSGPAVGPTGRLRDDAVVVAAGAGPDRRHVRDLGGGVPEPARASADALEHQGGGGRPRVEAVGGLPAARRDARHAGATGGPAAAVAAEVR